MNLHRDRKPLRVTTVLLAVVAVIGQVKAAEYISNLTNLWIYAGEIYFGDFHGLASGPYAGRFSTGASPIGSNPVSPYQVSPLRPPSAVATNSAVTAAFRVDAVTLEYLAGGQGEYRPWTNVAVTIYEESSHGTNLVGRLGNAVVDPRPTHFPFRRIQFLYTVYVDFFPLTEIVLLPSSDYKISVGLGDGCLVFVDSSAFVTPTDWQMGPSTAVNNPWAAGEFLKFSVTATPVWQTDSPTNVPTSVVLSATKAGTNLVLSWPASASRLALYSAAGLTTTAWSPVSTEPVAVGGRLVITLPLSVEGRYFRLRPYGQ